MSTIVETVKECCERLSTADVHFVVVVQERDTGRAFAAGNVDASSAQRMLNTAVGIYSAVEQSAAEGFKREAAS